jgi:beta-1,4-mannosyltransferase
VTDASPRRLRVLQSFTVLSETTNPYLEQLVTSLSGRVEVSLFSWRTAFSGRFDVLHIHWPELLVRGTSPLRSVARIVLFLAVLTSMRIRRQALVRTLHNDGPHEGGPRLESMALRCCDRRTTLWVLLNDASRPPRPAPTAVIPHGHYRDWLATVAAELPDRVPGRLLFFGLIRRYKGIEELLEAFTTLNADQATLRLIGRVVDAETAPVIEAAAAADHRVSSRLEFIPDADLVAELGRSQLVVLPYRKMNNSGAALLALSLDRTILVPDNPVTRALADEVGAQWVMRYSGRIGASDLVRALDETSAGLAGRPDLRRRDWPAVGAAHADAYLRAAQLAGRHRGHVDRQVDASR